MAYGRIPATVLSWFLTCSRIHRAKEYCRCRVFAFPIVAKSSASLVATVTWVLYGNKA